MTNITLSIPDEVYETTTRDLLEELGNDFRKSLPEGDGVRPSGAVSIQDEISK